MVGRDFCPEIVPQHIDLKPSMLVLVTCNTLQKGESGFSRRGRQVVLQDKTHTIHPAGPPRLHTTNAFC